MRRQFEESERKNGKLSKTSFLSVCYSLIAVGKNETVTVVKINVFAKYHICIFTAKACEGEGHMRIKDKKRSIYNSLFH